MTNLMITMLLGGLWHGAGWTFVLWGGLHGFYLMVNHGWRKLFPVIEPSRLRKLFGWIVTMLVVVIAWVPFRAESLDGAMAVLGAMVGSNGFALPEAYLAHLNRLAGLGDQLQAQGWVFGDTKLFKGIKEVSALLLLILIATLLPNTQQFMRRYRPALETYHGEIQRLRYRWLEWRPTLGWVVFIVCLSSISISMLSRASEFLYFQF